VIRNGVVVRSSIAAAAIPASWFALLVGVPAVLVDAGWQPWEVGLLLAPSAVVALLVPRVAGPLLERIGGTWSLALAAVIAALTMLMAALGTTSSRRCRSRCPWRWRPCASDSANRP
jgi:MFS family permease